jgi:hypothetical protein
LQVNGTKTISFLLTYNGTILDGNSQGRIGIPGKDLAAYNLKF